MEPEHGAFQSTLWSVIVRAQSGSDSERRAALEKLCRTYWPPLYAYVLKKGFPREDAQDAIQGFFAYFLEHGMIDRADAGRGRFRSYLRAVLDRHLANKRRTDGAEKRGGGAVPLSLDFETAERTVRIDPSSPETPEAAYDRAWRIAVLDQAILALKREYEKGGAVDRFSAVCAHLSAAGKRPSYEDLARKLGCPASDVNNLIHRARLRLGALIREKLRETVETESEVEEEMRDLFRIA